jgi:hypothetical protein
MDVCLTSIIFLSPENSRALLCEEEVSRLEHQISSIKIEYSSQIQKYKQDKDEVPIL